MTHIEKFILGSEGIARGGLLDGERVYYCSITDTCWVLENLDKFKTYHKSYLVKKKEYYPVFTASTHCDYIE